MTHEEVKNQGWIQTDGSSSTLQYGRKLGENSWQYRQWCDLPWEELPYTAAEKLLMWDASEWKQSTIDLWDYTEDQIIEALAPYGYKLNYYCRQDFNQSIILTVEDDGYFHSVRDSIQLVCECIFELEN